MARDRSRFRTRRSRTSGSRARTLRPATAGRPGWSEKRRREPARPRCPERRFVRAILVLTAVELEGRALARALELPALPAIPFPAFGGPALRIAPVGLRAALLESRWPSLLHGLDEPLVVSAGVCGGLDPALGVGDLVLPESVIDPGGHRYNVTPSNHRTAVAAAPDAATGTLISKRDAVGTPDAKPALFARTSAVAVDMESASILSRAATAGLPSLVVRAVSDTAAQSLPQELIRLVTPEGRLRLAAAVALMTRPTVLPRALGLQRATARALRAVGRVVAALASRQAHA